jgi:hypothetical protein
MACEFLEDVLGVPDCTTKLAWQGETRFLHRSANTNQKASEVAPCGTCLRSPLCRLWLALIERSVAIRGVVEEPATAAL